MIGPRFRGQRRLSSADRKPQLFSVSPLIFIHYLLAHEKISKVLTPGAEEGRVQVVLSAIGFSLVFDLAIILKNKKGGPLASFWPMVCSLQSWM
jgi:hypothetical protein